MCTFGLLAIYYITLALLCIIDMCVWPFSCMLSIYTFSVSITHYWYAHSAFRLCIIIMHIWPFDCALSICKFGISVMHYWYANSTFWLHIAICAFSLLTIHHQYAHLAFQLCIVIMNIWSFICLSLICIFDLLAMYYHYKNLSLSTVSLICVFDHSTFRSCIIDIRIWPLDYASLIYTFNISTYNCFRTCTPFSPLLNVCHFSCLSNLMRFGPQYLHNNNGLAWCWCNKFLCIHMKIF